MRPYVRPLIVTFSALGLATLISYTAIALTEPEAKETPFCHSTCVSVPMLHNPSGSIDTSEDARSAATFAKAKAEAASGEPAKLMTLASLYFMGIGTEKNENEAARLYRQGAEKGDAFCQFTFGHELLVGAGVKKDTALALAWLRKAAEQKQADAEYLLHEIYADGKDVPTDKTEARKWLLRAAEHGNHEARADIAEEILSEKDTKRYKAVATWARPGALAGHARSCHIMSFVYAAGIGVKEDQVESMAWRLTNLNLLDVEPPAQYRHLYESLSAADQQAAEKRAKELSGKRPYKSAFARDPQELLAEAKEFAATKLKAESGDAKAQYRLAMTYHFGRGTTQDAAEAARWCRKSAEQGYAIAQFTLGQTLRLGDGVEPDMKEAFGWYMKAALQGQTDAEHAVSMCYEDGEGVKADRAEARKWRRKAAEDGDPRSQCNLASDYARDKSDAANEIIAARWYRKAAEQLHPKGVYCLGYCYITGQGVPKDRIEGLAWMFTRTKDMTEEEQDMVKKLCADYTEEEIKRADQRGHEIFDQLLAKLKSESAKK